METIAGFFIMALFGFGIYAFFASNVEEYQFEKERKQKGKLKFASFISALEYLFTNYKVKEVSENFCIYELPINNGIKQIGSWTIKIIDNPQPHNNSAGIYYKHEYAIVVICNFINGTFMDAATQKIEQISDLKCQSIILDLKSKIELTQKYKDNIQIFSIN